MNRMSKSGFCKIAVSPSWQFAVSSLQSAKGYDPAPEGTPKNRSVAVVYDLSTCNLF